MVMLQACSIPVSRFLVLTFSFLHVGFACRLRLIHPARHRTAGNTCGSGERSGYLPLILGEISDTPKADQRTTHPCNVCWHHCRLFNGGKDADSAAAAAAAAAWLQALPIFQMFFLIVLFEKIDLFTVFVFEKNQAGVDWNLKTTNVLNNLFLNMWMFKSSQFIEIRNDDWQRPSPQAPTDAFEWPPARRAGVPTSGIPWLVRWVFKGILDIFFWGGTFFGR